MRIKPYVSVLLGSLLALEAGATTEFVSASNSVPMRAGKYPTVAKKKKDDPKKADEKKKDTPKQPYSDEKPFAEIVKDMDVIKGAFTFYRKVEENKFYLDDNPDAQGMINTGTMRYRPLIDRLEHAGKIYHPVKE